MYVSQDTPSESTNTFASNCTYIIVEAFFEFGYVIVSDRIFDLKIIAE